MTQIFKDYSAFQDRQDKDINGVDEAFAKEHLNYQQENATNKGCWNCSGCSGCSRCSDCSDCSRCSGCSGCSRCSSCSGCSRCYDCSDCSGCYDCSDCSRCYDCSGCSSCSGCSRCYDCSDCSGCYDCSDCSRCYDCSGCSRCSSCSGCYDKNGEKENDPFEVPIIENIHQKVLEATSKEGALKMSAWHSCETTHCRGGWVEVLAGEKGKALADRTSTLFAAMQIYKASSPIEVAPPRFFESDKIAMADIVRCAELEKEQTKI